MDTGEAPEVLDDAEPPPDPVVKEEEAPAFDDSDLAGWLFSMDRIHTIAITLPPESEAALAASPYEWARASVEIDGEAVPDVGVRLRGKIGSYRTLAGKPKFKLSFDAFVDDQLFYGLEHLSLNNSVVDCSYMKEVVGWRLYALAGVPHLRTSYGRVTVNGADYGLYVLVETPDEQWLARHYDDSSGNLYDGKYVWYGGGSYTLLDFGDGVDSLFSLEEGEDVGNADIAAVSSALLTNIGTDAFYPAVGEVLDWERFHRMTAVDQLVGHNDGYSMNTNNYRIYFDPANGKADFLPWDLDYAFLYDYQWGFSWASPKGNVTAMCWADQMGCAPAHQAVVADVVARIEAVDWEAELDAIEALTYADAVTDPRRECAASDIQPTRDYVRTYLQAAPGNVRMFWHL
jgi:hypothetical protein